METAPQVDLSRLAALLQALDQAEAEQLRSSPSWAAIERVNEAANAVIAEARRLAQQEPPAGVG